MNDIKNSELIHPLGHAMVMLGGDVYDQRITGDIISEFKWVKGEPVMLLYKNTLGRNSKAYMIEMKDAHEFAMADGTASKKLVSQLCHDAAAALGAENDKSTIFRLIDIILDGLPDLLMMPPEPTELEKANRPSSGNDELSILMNGKKIIETVV